MELYRQICGDREGQRNIRNVHLFFLSLRSCFCFWPFPSVFCFLWKIYAEFIKSHRREVGGRPDGNSIKPIFLPLFALQSFLAFVS